MKKYLFLIIIGNVSERKMMYVVFPVGVSRFYRYDIYILTSYKHCGYAEYFFCKRVGGDISKADRSEAGASEIKRRDV